MATKSISQIKIGSDYYNLIDANAVHSTGTLPVENGGTGATTAAGAVVNIVDGQHIKPQQISATSHVYTMNGNVGTGEGNVYTLHGDVRTYDGDVVIKDASGTDLHKLSEKANTDHEHSASNITSGILPIAQGGTGASNATEARMSLDAAQSGGAVGTLAQAETAAAITALNFAPIEYDGRPSQTSHEVGEYILRARGDHYEIRFLYYVIAPIAEGGTIDNSNTVQVTAMEEFAHHTHSANAITSGTFNTNRIPPLDASKISSGILPVVYGGTGQSAVSNENTVGNIATAGADCTIKSARYLRWGNVAQLFLAVRCDSAKDRDAVVANIVGGKQPIYTIALMNSMDPQYSCIAYNNGEVQVKNAVTAGTVIYVSGTYLVA